MNNRIDPYKGMRNPWRKITADEEKEMLRQVEEKSVNGKINIIDYMAILCNIPPKQVMEGLKQEHMRDAELVHSS